MTVCLCPVHPICRFWEMVIYQSSWTSRLGHSPPRPRRNLRQLAVLWQCYPSGRNGYQQLMWRTKLVLKSTLARKKAALLNLMKPPHRVHTHCTSLPFSLAYVHCSHLISELPCQMDFVFMWYKQVYCALILVKCYHAWPLFMRRFLKEIAAFTIHHVNGH